MITNHGRTAILTDYDSRVISIRLNSSITVSDFLIKEVEAQIYTIEFDIPEGISNLTIVELLDSNNNVLSRANLFVPVDINTRYKHVTRVVQ